MARRFSVLVDAVARLDKKGFKQLDDQLEKMRDKVEGLDKAERKRSLEQRKAARHRIAALRGEARELDRLRAKMRHIYGSAGQQTGSGRLSAMRARLMADRFGAAFNGAMDRAGDRLRGSLAASAASFRKSIGSAGKNFSVNMRRGMVNELKSIGRLVPGVKQGVFKSGMIGKALGKLFPGPQDILNLPNQATALIRQNMLGLGVFLGIPLIVHQIQNVLGGAIAAIGPIALTAFGILNKQVMTTSKTTGVAVNALRDFHAAAQTIMGGSKLQKGVLGLEGALAAATSGQFETLASGKLSKKGKEQKALADFLNGSILGGNGPQLGDVLNTLIKREDVTGQMDTLFQAIQDLRDPSREIRKTDGSVVSLHERKKLSRRLADLLGEAAGEALNAVDQNLRRGQSQREARGARRQRIGTIFPSTMTSIQRFFDAIDQMMETMQGIGTGLANARFNVLTKWFESLANFLERTQDARIQGMVRIFDTMAKTVGGWFDSLDKMSDADAEASVKSVFDVLDSFTERLPALVGSLGAIAKSIGILFSHGGFMDRLGSTIGNFLYGMVLGLDEASKMEPPATTVDRINKFLATMLEKGLDIDIKDDQTAIGVMAEGLVWWWSRVLDRVNSILSDEAGIEGTLSKSMQMFLGAIKNENIAGKLGEVFGHIARLISDGIAALAQDLVSNKGFTSAIADIGVVFCNALYDGLYKAFEGTFIGFFLPKRVTKEDQARVDAETRLASINSRLRRSRIPGFGISDEERFRLQTQRGIARQGAGYDPKQPQTPSENRLGIVPEKLRQGAEAHVSAAEKLTNAASALTSAAGKLSNVKINIPNFAGRMAPPTGSQAPKSSMNINGSTGAPPAGP